MGPKVQTSTSITFTREALHPALELVQSTIERRNTIPVLGNILIKIAGAEVRLDGTDLDIEIEATCAGRIESVAKGAEAITLHAATLYDIVRKLDKSAEIRLEWGADGGQASLKAGRSRFALHTLPASDFPDIATGELSHEFTLPGKALARLIGDTAFAISTEETRYYLNGIYFHTDGNTLVAVATDGHRLAKSTLLAPEGALNGTTGTRPMPGIIVPRKTISEVQKLIKAADGDIHVSLSSHKIRFEAGGYILTSKLIGGTFPDYQRVIPQKNAGRATMERGTLATVADRVMTISGDKERKLKLSLADNRLSVSVRSPDLGEAEEEMPIDYAGTPMEIGFNGRYLSDILGAVESETVMFALGDPGSPTLIRASEDAPALFVLMPMRL